MNRFISLGENITYEEGLQLDGAATTTHINYNQSMKFNGIDAKEMACYSRIGSISSKAKIEDVYANLYDFDGTEENLSREDKLIMWEKYWMEYFNAFEQLCNILPESVVTLFIGRQAIELGFKYLILKKNHKIKKGHALDQLAMELFNSNDVHESYMEDVQKFCELYSKLGNCETRDARSQS